MKLLSALLLSALPGYSGPAAVTLSAERSGFSPEAQDLSSAVEEIRAESGAPGLVAVAVQDGMVVAWGVAGVRAAGSETPLQVDDPMHLGSCGKAMTSTMIARLVEEGTLEFETTIAEALPDLAEKIDPGFHEVTIEQLIRHRGGIAERRRPEIQAYYDRLGAMEGENSEVRLEMLALVMSHPPLLPEAGQFDYSNFGYMTAGAMAEAVTGKAWEELMEEKVFAPLDMESAGTHSPTGDDVPVGHTADGDGFEALPPGPGGALHACMGPAGLVHASLPDWGRFATEHMRGERGEDGMLEAATYRRLHAKVDGSDYAAGWGISQHTVSWSEPTLSLSHNGSDNTWYTMIQIFPEWDLAVLAASNCGSPAGSRAVDSASDALLEKLGFSD